METIIELIDSYKGKYDGWTSNKILFFVDLDYEEIEKNKRNRYSSYDTKTPNLFLEFRKIAHQLANDSEVLSNDELRKDNSLRFVIILEACNLKLIQKEDYYSYSSSTKNRVNYIVELYKDRILDLAQDRNLVKKLPDYYKRILRQLKKDLDPKNNLNFVEFKDYSNPLSMIAFINGHIKSAKKLPQNRAKEVLHKVLLDDRYFDIEYDDSKVKTVILFCVNNLAEFLAYNEKKKLIKFAFEHIPYSAKDIFFTMVQKHPDNYIKILFSTDMYIRLCGKFSSDEVQLFVAGIKDKDKALEIMKDNAYLISRKLAQISNSGGTKIFRKDIRENFKNKNAPYLSDIMRVFNDLDYNLKNIFLALGYSKDEY